MNIRDKLRKQSKPVSKKSEVPQWVENGTETTKTLFETTMKEYQRIKELIETGDSKRTKDRKLVLSTIAKLSGRDRSIVTPRRQPELYDYIERLNSELESLINLQSTTLNNTRTQTKRELEKENASLRRRIKKDEEAIRRAIVEEFFKSNLLDDRDKLAKENLRLRYENDELKLKISRLEQLTKKINTENAELHNLLTSQQRGRLQSLKLVDNDNNSTSKEKD